MAPGGYGNRARCGPAASGSRGCAPEPGGHTRHSPPPTPCQQLFVMGHSQYYFETHILMNIKLHALPFY